MRKGTTLVELLISVTVIMILVGISATLDLGAMGELPRQAAISQHSVPMDGMLRTLRQDVAGASALQADADSITLDSADGKIAYRRAPGAFTRTFTPPTGRPDLRTWRLGPADIQWQCWRQGQRAYALEIRTAFVMEHNARAQRKLANSQVFFLTPGGTP